MMSPPTGNLFSWSCSLQGYELGLGERHPVAMALGNPGEVVNCGLPGLLAMADREIQGMEVGVLAHTLPALLGRKRGQEEGHRLPILLGHDGGPGGRAEHIAVFLPALLPPCMAGVKRLHAGLEQRAFIARLEPVSGEDRELVAAVLLAQPTDDILAILVLRVC